MVQTENTAMSSSMETKDIKMSRIHYTNDDLWLLGRKIPWLRSSIKDHLNGKPMHMTEISIHNEKTTETIICVDLWEYLSKYYTPMYTTMNEPIENMPLKINSKSDGIKQIALWRLEIGK